MGTEVLGVVSEVVSLRLRRCRNLHELHIELGNIIEQGLRRRPPRKCPPSSYYSRIMAQMDEVAMLQQRLNSRVFQWNESDKTLRENLQHVLQIEFPSPVTSQKSDFTVKCSICYAYRLVKTTSEPGSNATSVK